MKVLRHLMPSVLQAHWMQAIETQLNNYVPGKLLEILITLWPIWPRTQGGGELAAPSVPQAKLREVPAPPRTPSLPYCVWIGALLTHNQRALDQGQLD